MAGSKAETSLDCDDQDEATRLFHNLERDDGFGVLVWLRMEEWDGTKWQRRLET